MGDPKDYQFDLPPALRLAPIDLPEKIHRRAWAAAPKCTSLRKTPALEAVRVIVIHATAGSSSDGAISVMEEGRASFHWLVPNESEAAHGQFVWASAPEARAAWHVRGSCAHADVCDGMKGLNAISLGVEVVNTLINGDEFSSWQVEAAAKIVRYAWAKYPNLVHVVSHARLDPSRRSDPGAHFPWRDFQSLVLD